MVSQNAISSTRTAAPTAITNIDAMATGSVRPEGVARRVVAALGDPSVFGELNQPGAMFDAPLEKKDLIIEISIPIGSIYGLSTIECFVNQSSYISDLVAMTVRHLFTHLCRVVALELANQASSKCIAICFGSTLFNADNDMLYKFNVVRFLQTSRSDIMALALAHGRRLWSIERGGFRPYFGPSKYYSIGD
ncbi:hypothetical protein Aperf_G00000107017 [Anoplocephala perfoliata]